LPSGHNESFQFSQFVCISFGIAASISVKRAHPANDVRKNRTSQARGPLLRRREKIAGTGQLLGLAEQQDAVAGLQTSRRGRD